MKLIIIFFIVFLISPYLSQYSYSLELYTDNKVYTEKQPLFLYGYSSPNENIIIRLFYPDGTVAKFDQISADANGLFNHILLIWPESSPTFPYGTYTLELTSVETKGLSKIIDLKFSISTEMITIPISNDISVSLFVPEIVAVDNLIRLFVQITSDGMLIGDDPNNLLDTSHVHLPSNQVESLSSKFNTLHQGLYFIDYMPHDIGTFVFHIITFDNGIISHKSAITTVVNQDINGISEQLATLNSIFDDTVVTLDKLQTNVENFGFTLENANNNINQNVKSISDSVHNIEETSLQLNSLLLPIIASVGIIMALQIATLARRR